MFESIETALFPVTPLPISDGLARSIEFRRKAGTWLSFPYHTMTAIEYTPNSRIDVTFGDKCISVRGRNLDSVYEGIRGQKLSRVCETDRADSLEADDRSAVIEAIVEESRGSHLKPPLDGPASQGGDLSEIG